MALYTKPDRAEFLGPREIHSAWIGAKNCREVIQVFIRPLYFVQVAVLVLTGIITQLGLRTMRVVQSDALDFPPTNHAILALISLEETGQPEGI